MKGGKGARKRKDKDGTYVLRLFVAGNESNSLQARTNLASACEKYIQGNYKIHVVDVLKDAAAAYRNNVLVTPTLVLIRPLPKVTVLGNLSDTRRLLASLRLLMASDE